MKKKIRTTGKKAMAVALTTAMTASGLSMAAPVGVQAAGTPADRDDNSIIYAVDCGDVNPATAPEDGPLGTHNSVTEQIYGEDPETGYKWGIDDTVSTPLANGAGASPVGVSTDWTWANESVTTDQKSKTSTNRYTKNQYEKGVTERHLDYKFEIENGTYFVEVGFVDPWSCSKTPTVYANKGQDDEKVMAENFDVSSNNGVVTGTVEVTDGELTINASGTGDTNKAINMTYITIKEGGDASMAQTDLDAISLNTTVTADIDLPLKGSKADSTITWKSSNTAVITNAGKVTRPASGEKDAEVVLTATAKYGEATKTKTFTVTVKAMNGLMGSEFFALNQVEVTDPYYDEALELDVDNLLALDADRLLAGFRETAGYAAGMEASAITTFMKNKTRYGGGWENSLIGGHTLGHYMSAVAQGIVNPGLSKEDQDALKERLAYLVEALAECQEKTEGTAYEGYLFGATLPTQAFKNKVDLQFDNVEKGQASISTQAWVPWYTMHKILAGLVDAYEVGGNDQALEVANKLATWISNRANAWSAATQSTVLGIEYGGMNDVLYQLYKVTDADNKEDFKQAAHQFDETALFEKVLSGVSNALDGKHANTTIPKFLGALNRYEVDNTETKYLQYAEAFWQMVKDRHTYITGGNSENEHFGADEVLNAERTRVNNETCNTYNMLKLSRKLFAITGDKKYADYYENTLINAIMSSQEHEHGMTMYFQPMESGYHKVFGTLDSNFWCCTGSGMENFTKLQDSIYFKKDDTVIVNQYLASKLTDGSYVLTQTGDLSKDNTMTFAVTGTMNKSLQLRVPDWTKNMTVKFGSEEYEYTVRDGYIEIPAEKLTDGVSFTVTMPMETVAYNLPDGENTYAFKYGPFVLSAKLGKNQSTSSHGVAVTVPATKAVTDDTIGIRNAESVEAYMEAINENLVKEDGAMNFTLKGTNFNYTFTTHYNQDEENYGIYWTYYIDEDGRGSAAVLESKEAARIADASIDRMEQVGRGQYEERFLLTDGETKDGFIDNGSAADTDKLTRYANAGGSFSYKMIADEENDNYLVVTFAKEDDGKPIKISVGDTVIAEETLNSETAQVNNVTLAQADQSAYYQVMYKIPLQTVKDNVQDLNVTEEGETRTKRVITITFAGTEDDASARICKSLATMRAYRTTNDLNGVMYDGKKLEEKEGTYAITTPYDKDPEVTFDLKDAGGYIDIDGNAIDETETKKLKTTGKETEFTINVHAQDFKVVKTYKIVVTRDYSTINLKDSLVKGFTFDDTVGDAKAVTKAFTPAEAAKPVYTYEEGVNGKALKMSGSYGMKLMDDTSALGESYTISFWMKSNSVGSAINPTLTAGKFSPEYWLNLTLDGKIWSKANDTYIDTQASSAYVANQWQNVVLVVDGETDGTAANTVNGKLYVDGKLVTDGNIAKGIMTQSGGKLYFGLNAWDAIFTGALDEVLVFNKALSVAEVQGISAKAVTTETLDVKDEQPSGTEAPTPTEGTSGTEAPAPTEGTAGTASPAPTAQASAIPASNAGANAVTPGAADGEMSSGNDQQSGVKAKAVTVKAAGYLGNTITLVKGKKVKLKATVSPAKASQGVTYKSDKNKVAKVSSSGVVTAKKAGTAKITVSAENGKKKVITIKVVKKAKKNKKLVLKKTKLSLKKGKTAQIAVKSMTKGTTDKFTYKSSKKIAAVDQYGMIKAKAKGKAVITVKCGKAVKKIKVTVK